jgi:hypothetical protein
MTLPNPDIITTDPVIVLSFDSDGFDATRVFSPSVTLVGGTYFMLYGGLPFANNEQIGLARSSDGSTWIKYSPDPVISNSSSPEWDSFREVPVTLIYDNGVYRAWFNGDNTNLSTDPGATSGFGYATSTDGIHWTQAATNPIRNDLVASSYILNEIVKINGTFDAYYSRNGVSYEASSLDGVVFTNDTPVIVDAGYNLVDRR